MNDPHAVADIAGELDALFASRGTKGFLYASDLSDGREVALRADTSVVTGSVFKVAVVLDYACQVAEGTVSPAERIRVSSAQRVGGSQGLSTFLDEVEISLRDLATSMMTVSDNTATDIVMERLGLESINARLQRLGLMRTHVVCSCAEIIRSLIEDIPGCEDIAGLSQAPAEAADLCRAMDSESATRTTPREMATLLRLIATDAAGPADACAEVRRIMGLQAWTHRLRSGFPDSVRVWAKTGTIMGVRNEAGVVEFPDGRRYAVTVFTRGDAVDFVNPAVDRVIGESAALAVSALRGGSS